MIIIKDGKESTETHLNNFCYIENKTFLTKLVLRITRYLRAKNAEKYIDGSINNARILDIGCGDGYFLQRLRCFEKYGIDKSLGDVVEDKLNFPDAFFDYVTMLAVIEHLTHPEAILNEIYRVLKPDGKLIITTPKNVAEHFIKLYVKNVEKEHKSYFILQSIETLIRGKFSIIESRTFLLGLNQIFCLQKRH